MESDEYLSHRVAQAFDMSQFIKYTSKSCDLLIVGGDFNLRPTDLGYKMIVTNGNLLDCWLAKVSFSYLQDMNLTCFFIIEIWLYMNRKAHEAKPSFLEAFLSLMNPYSLGIGVKTKQVQMWKQYNR